VKKLWPYVLLLIIIVSLFGDFIFSNKVLFGTDFMDLGYFAVKLFRDHVVKIGSYPLWDPYIHGGMPFIEALHGAIFSPISTPIRILFPAHRSFGLSEIVHIFLAGLFMFLLLRFYKLRNKSSFFGALTYMLLPLTVSMVYAGHDGKISVIALLPLQIWLLERALKHRRIRDFAWFSLGYAALIFTAHMQLAYFASWLIAGLFIFRVIRMWRIDKEKFNKVARIVLLFVVFLLLGVCISAIQLLGPYDYLGKYSVRTIHTEQRGIEFSNSWRANIEDIVSVFVPDFVGQNVGEKFNAYWGRNIFRLNSLYIGLLISLLGIVGFLALKKPLLHFFGLFSVFIITYSMGTQTPLFYLYYYIIPGVKKFRAPETALFVAAFAFVVAATFVIDKVLSISEAKKSSKKPPKIKNHQITKLYKYILYTGIIGSVVVILLVVFGKSVGQWWINTVYDPHTVNISRKIGFLKTNYSIFTGSAFLSLILSWIGIGALLWKIRNRKISSVIIIILLCIPVLVDFWRFDRRFIVTGDINRYYTKTNTISFLQQYRETYGPFRVFALPQTLSYAQLGSFGVEVTTLEELHGNQLRWYDEFTGKHEKRSNLIMYPHFWDILNFKFILSPQQLNIPTFKLIQSTESGFLYHNFTAFPRIRSFHKWEVLDQKDILAELKNPDFVMGSLDNYRTILLLDEDPKLLQNPFGDTAYIFGVEGKVIEDKEDEYTFEINMPKNGIAFISSNWYPAWHAEENGNKLPVIRADYSFIGIPLKAGNHIVKMYYSAPILNISLGISLVSLIIAIGVLVGSFVIKPRKKK